MFKKIFQGHIVTIVVLYFLLAVFLLFFDPYKLPAPLLFLPFIFFFAATALFLYRAIQFGARKLHLKLSKGLAARLSLAISGWPTFIVLLQSVGQVGVYDIIISIILFVSIDFYLARSRIAIFDKR